MKKNWHGLMKILEVQHIRNGEVIWEDKNLYNTLHVGGELFILSCCFDNDGTLPPPNYYFGLDNRSEITVDDLLTDLEDEPFTNASPNGYSRVPVSSSVEFTLDVVNGNYRAISQVLQFSAIGLGYGPVSKLFMSTTTDNTGILIATTQLSSAVTLAAGETLNMRMGLSLQDI